MLRKHIQLGSLLVNGFFMIYIGILSIRKPISLITLLYYGLSIGLPIMGIYQMVSSFFSKNKKSYKISSIIDGLAALGAGIIIYLHPLDVLSITPYVIGGYCLLKAIICGFNFYVHYVDRLKGQILILFETILYLGFGIVLIVNPLYKGRFVLTIMGIYFICYGLIQISNFFQALFPNRKSHKLKMTLPIFMNVLLPQKLVYYINRMLNEQGATSSVLSPINKENLPYDMEILIHLGAKGFDSVGHVDVAFDNIILSYGCHDHHNTSCGGALGPGVIHFNEKTKYIDFVIHKRSKQLVGFGIHLTPSQKKATKEALLELATRFEPWYSDQDKKEKGEPYLGDCQNYASKLSSFCRSKFYKFKSGKFKTYFIMTTNCVLLVDSLLGKSGIDLWKINGIITPGAYYEFLDNEFVLPHSNVVYRKVYTKETISDLKEHPDLVNSIHDMQDPTVFIQENIFKETLV